MERNVISFIGLSTEYCTTLESVRESDKQEFVRVMLHILPRLYIMATDLPSDESPAYMENLLDEDYYDSIRRGVENLLGPDDVYLEVFEQDMKYSDTPIAASISEGLCDIFQVLYNFLGTVKDATDEVVGDAVAVVRDDFATYWSRILCNVLRALNHVEYSVD